MLKNITFSDILLNNGRWGYMDFEWKHNNFSQPFIKELRQEKRQYGGKILRTFIISSDGEKFYKVRS